MEKLRKLQVVATEGNYNEEEIFTLVDLYTESLLIIAKNFDLLIKDMVNNYVTKK